MLAYGYMLAAIVVGMFVSAQPPLNAILSRAVGNPYGATAISIFIAFLTILAMVAFTGPGEISRRTLSSVPWWVYLAGTAGAIFVGAGVVIAPVTGTLVFFACIIAGQLIGSALADQFGAFGLETRTISAWRVAGIAMVLVGALLASRN